MKSAFHNGCPLGSVSIAQRLDRIKAIEAAFEPASVTVLGLPDGDRTARDYFILEEGTLSTRGDATGKRGNLKKGVEIVG